MFKKILITILLISLLVLPTRVFAIRVPSAQEQIQNILIQIEILQEQINQIENKLNMKTTQKKEVVKPKEKTKEKETNNAWVGKRPNLKRLIVTP